MRLPKQAKPVMHARSSANIKNGGVKPSDIKCDLCMIACNQLSGIARDLCIIACNNTVC
jgi:hypothetical protein